MTTTASNKRDNPDRPDATDVFHNMPTRLIGERDERVEQGARAMNFCQTFLDDYLRCITTDDLVLFGAPTGAGKTDMAVSISMANAQKECRIGYFALEAKPRELEQRIKYSWISSQAWSRRIDRVGELNYPDWALGRCEDILGALDDEADRWMASNLSTLWTFYRGKHFDQKSLVDSIRKHQSMFDLLVIDHLHYIDHADDNENAGVGEVVKALRDAQLDVQKPVLLVAQLRKRDQRMKQLIPHIEDFLGSKHVANICTQAITIEKASNVEAPKWWLSPTYIAVLKDRRQGPAPFVALTMFDKRTRRYEDTYALGRLTKGGTEWTPIKQGEAAPGWANGHRQTELEFA